MTKEILKLTKDVLVTKENIILKFTIDELIILNEVLLHALDDNMFNYEYTIGIENLLKRIEAIRN